MNDVLRGDNPPGVEAGVSLELLAEQASGRFEPQMQELRKTVVRRDEFRLSLVRLATAWKMGKQLLIQDEDGVPQAIKLGSMDIAANPRIEIESAPPALFTHTTKQARLGRALEAGLIDLTVPENRGKLRNELGVSGYKDPVSADVELAQTENYALMKGERVPVRRFEDPREHLKIHRRLLLRADFEKLDMKVREAVEEHYLATVAAVRRLAADMLPAPEPIVPAVPAAQPKRAKAGREEMNAETDGLSVA
jgi:hypothetical protein